MQFGPMHTGPLRDRVVALRDRTGRACCARNGHPYNAQTPAKCRGLYMVVYSASYAAAITRAGSLRLLSPKGPAALTANQ